MRALATVLGPAAMFVAACLVHCGSSESEAPPADAAPPEDDAGPKRRDAAPDVEDAGPAPDPLPPTEGSGTRFRVMRLVTKYSDGSVLKEGAFFDDRQLGHSCSLSEIAPDRWACLPSSLGGASDYGLFSDAACTNAVLVVSGSPQSSDPTYVVWGEPCARKFTRAMPLMKKVPAYRKNPTTDACEVLLTDQTLTPKVEIPASTFGTFVRVAEQVVAPERDGSRVTIIAERLVSDDGAFQALPRRLVDRGRNAIGDIALASDLKRRVLTTSYYAFATGWFGDPTCTQKMVAVKSSLSSRMRSPSTRWTSR